MYHGEYTDLMQVYNPFIVISHLQYRGCSLLGINACPDLDSQKQRFLGNGWGNAWALDMAETYRLLPRDEVHRCVWFPTS